MTPSTKNRALIAYHGLSLTASAITLNSSEFKSGPCTPNLDLLFSPLVLITDVVLLLISTVKAVDAGHFKTAIGINVAGLAVLLLIFKLSR